MFRLDRLYLGQKGFSLVQVMIASGIMGGLALMVANLSKNQTIVQKRADASLEINTISNIVSQALLNNDACIASLGGPGAPISDGINIPSIKNRAGADVFDTVKNYNQVKLNYIQLKDLVYSAGPGVNKFGDAKLEIEFEKTSPVLKGNTTIRKGFPIKLEVDSSNNLVRCYSSVENAVDSSITEACESIGGIFDMINRQCNLSTYNSADTPEDNVAVSTKHLKDFYDDQTSTTLDPRFVNITGDTMTGSLTVNAQVNTSNRYCVNGRCRDFNAAPCPTGQVVRQINEDGTVQCSNVTCPDPNTFYVGVDASGNPICKAFPTNTCGANQYVKQVNSDGTVVCGNLPPGTNKNCSPGAIQRIDAAGNHYCVNLPSDTNVYGKSCSAGESLRGFDSSGNPICNTGAGISCTVKSASMPANHSCGGGICTQATVSCDSGWTRTGGGCNNSWYDGYRASKSYPSGTRGWTCTGERDSHASSGVVYVICCK